MSSTQYTYAGQLIYLIIYLFSELHIVHMCMFIESALQSTQLTSQLTELPVCVQPISCSPLALTHRQHHANKRVRSGRRKTKQQHTTAALHLCTRVRARQLQCAHFVETPKQRVGVCCFVSVAFSPNMAASSSCRPCATVVVVGVGVLLSEEKTTTTTIDLSSLFNVYQRISYKVMFAFHKSLLL